MYDRVSHLILKLDRTGVFYWQESQLCRRSVVSSIYTYADCLMQALFLLCMPPGGQCAMCHVPHARWVSSGKSVLGIDAETDELLLKKSLKVRVKFAALSEGARTALHRWFKS